MTVIDTSVSDAGREAVEAAPTRTKPPLTASWRARQTRDPAVVHGGRPAGPRVRVSRRYRVRVSRRYRVWVSRRYRVWVRARASGQTVVDSRSAMIWRMRSAVSDGVLPTLTPAASRASFLAWAVPEEPETMAPAWPIVLPSGAVKPAT